MQETAKTRVGRRCSGHRGKRRFVGVIVAAGMGVWLFSGNSRALAADECAHICPATDCNNNNLADSCDVSCDNDGDFCGTSGCDILSCEDHGCGYSNDCNNNGIPDECEDDCNADGVPDDCEDACCLGDVCTNLDAGCCTTQGGTPRGEGTTCTSTVACCFDFDCADLDPECCLAQGGVAAGPGSDCDSGICDSEGFACCKADGADENNLPVPWCDNYSLYICVDLGGTPLSTTLGCAALQLIADEDGDGVIDDCDNCTPSYDDCDFPFDCDNLLQVDGDLDGVGNTCDNCVTDENDDQADADGDAIGDLCDNCSSIANAPRQGSCLNGDPVACDEDADCDTSPGFGDGICSADQEDCDTDGAGDVCEADCDDDGIPDDCDTDIDNDGVDNGDDICDYTPGTLTVDDDGVFIGTVRADLDGDCDVDDDDADLLDALIGDSTCDPMDGVPSEGELCDGQAQCAPCNSCCLLPPLR